jgi:hypothetical protein
MDSGDPFTRAYGDWTPVGVSPGLAVKYFPCVDRIILFGPIPWRAPAPVVGKAIMMQARDPLRAVVVKGPRAQDHEKTIMRKLIIL